ncbi:hypothetical protein ACFQ10_42215 [Streptomyces indonesiensis]
MADVRGQLVPLERRADGDDGFTAQSEQFVHRLTLVAGFDHGVEHEGVAVLPGGGVQGLDDAHVVRLAHGEQHAQLAAPRAAQKLGGGVGAVAQFLGRLEHPSARIGARTGLVAEHQ